MKVIGSGFGRTGTLSMKMALEQLGLGPCYHMEEVIKRPQHIKIWHDIAHGKTANWPALFENFQATVDFPASTCYQELATAFPEAKVIHTVREPEKWYESTRQTIYKGSTIFPLWLQKRVKRIGRFVEMQEQLIWHKIFNGTFENRLEAIKIFNQWTEEVIETIPADRLLVFSVKEGWEPLCHFLGVPVPNTPFPYVNDKKSFQNKMRMITVVTTLVPVVLVSLLILGLYGFYSKYAARQL